MKKIILGIFLFCLISFLIGFIVGSFFMCRFIINEGTAFIERHGIDLTLTSQQIADLIEHYKGVIAQKEGSGGLFANSVIK